VKAAWTQETKPRRSIVIVDDEKSYVELMAQMLAENLDCPVHAFTRPAEALKVLDAVSPGVIVTDYSMPQMNGLDFIKEASKRAAEATFVLISGEDLDPMIGEFARLRRLKIRLRKPFGWRPLADAILKVWPGTNLPSYRLLTEEQELATEARLGSVIPLP
jgi:DNA-binding NtrC family response regulator